jgi:hypothetical protein
MPSCLLSQNIINAGSRGYGMGHRGYHRYIYIASARDQVCEYVNQFYVSFGLDDRYLILIVTKCYRDI